MQGAFGGWKQITIAPLLRAKCRRSTQKAVAIPYERRQKKQNWEKKKTKCMSHHHTHRSHNNVRNPNETRPISNPHSTYRPCIIRLPKTQPESRPRLAYRLRREAARRERRATEKEPVSCQMNNGEADLAGKFHKTLPHDEFGRVRRGRRASFCWPVESQGGDVGRAGKGRGGRLECR